MSTFVRSTTMSTKRIVISLIILILIPVIRMTLVKFTGNDTLSLMFSLNLAALVLLIYDWELFGLHWNRTKNNFADTVLYSALGAAVIFALSVVNHNYLYGQMVFPEASTFSNYPIAIPPILFAYSISQSLIMNMEFKCLTDHFKIHDRELAMILISGFMFGLLWTLLMTPFRLSLFLQTYLYHICLISLLAYLYNQTHSIISGMIAMAAVYLAWQILFLL